MTLEKACSDTEIFLAASEPGTSSTRGKCLTTELPRFLQWELQWEEEVFPTWTSWPRKLISNRKTTHNDHWAIIIAPLVAIKVIFFLSIWCLLSGFIALSKQNKINKIIVLFTKIISREITVMAAIMHWLVAWLSVSTKEKKRQMVAEKGKYNTFPSSREG